MMKNTAQCDIEQHAILFACMAKALFDACPDDAEQVLRAGVRTYGTERGARMAARCLRNGDVCTPQNYQVYNERSSRPGQMNSVPAQKTPEYILHVKKCAWVDAWEKHGLLAYGRYYCLDIDKSLTRGFKKDYEVKIGGWLSWGAEYCDMRWGFSMDEQTELAIRQKRADLAEGAVLDYNFHTGHLFSTLAHEFSRLAGKAGEDATRNALEDFCRRFGREYVLAFSQAYPMSGCAGEVFAHLELGNVTQGSGRIGAKSNDCYNV